MDMAAKARAWIALVAVACAPAAAPPPATARPATAEEISAFCMRVDEIGDVSRSELLRGLIDVAPPEVEPAIRRASDLGGSMEDDAVIDAWLDRCRESAEE